MGGDHWKYNIIEIYFENNPPKIISGINLRNLLKEFAAAPLKRLRKLLHSEFLSFLIGEGGLYPDTFSNGVHLSLAYKYLQRLRVA